MSICLPLSPSALIYKEHPYTRTFTLFDETGTIRRYDDAMHINFKVQIRIFTSLKDLYIPASPDTRSSLIKTFICLVYMLHVGII